MRAFKLVIFGLEVRVLSMEGLLYILHLGATLHNRKIVSDYQQHAFFVPTLVDNQIDCLLAGVFGGHPVEDPSTISPSGDVE